jgi:hypothetical protein
LAVDLCLKHQALAPGSLKHSAPHSAPRTPTWIYISSGFGQALELKAGILHTQHLTRCGGHHTRKTASSSFALQNKRIRLSLVSHRCHCFPSSPPLRCQARCLGTGSAPVAAASPRRRRPLQPDWDDAVCGARYSSTFLDERDDVFTKPNTAGAVQCFAVLQCCSVAVLQCCSVDCSVERSRP